MGPESDMCADTCDMPCVGGRRRRLREKLQREAIKQKAEEEKDSSDSDNNKT